jgi:NADH-quinone oxidoreductase subunit L
MVADGMRFEIGFLVDRLTALMMATVTFVSLMVHIYTIGYMADDEHNWPKGRWPARTATSASSATSRCSPSRC